MMQVTINLLWKESQKNNGINSIIRSQVQLGNEDFNRDGVIIERGIKLFCRFVYIYDFGSGKILACFIPGQIS